MKKNVREKSPKKAPEGNNGVNDINTNKKAANCILFFDNLISFKI